MRAGSLFFVAFTTGATVAACSSFDGAQPSNDAGAPALEAGDAPADVLVADGASQDDARASGVAVAAGVLLFLTPRARSSTTAALRMTPSSDGRSAGMTVIGRF